MHLDLTLDMVLFFQVTVIVILILLSVIMPTNKDIQKLSLTMDI